MKARKLVLFALFAAMLVSLAACSENPSGHSKTLGIVMPGETHGFLGESIKHAEKAAAAYAEKYGIEYKFLTSADSTEQAAQIDTLIALGVLDAMQAYDGDLNIKLISGVSGSSDYLDTFAPILAEYGISQVTYEYSPSMIKRAIEAGFQILDKQSMPVKIIVPTAEVDNASEVKYRTSTVYIERYE